ncbi:hypothetical protein D3C87_214400 [compost metagenome]|uniref:hypothetical protein n=1 Tax=Pedobacter sp. ok626 TaxID=1761882 RepID=UPI00088C83C0|nr:hypothetical protein [Pedobacter sp. ok626]SDJ93498.1 hypothetical protein SAMN04487898_10594 [Pedobacter sp. ok626]
MNLNIKFIFYSCLCLLWLSAFSCKKLELAESDPPNVINLFVKGTTLTDTLEFLKDGKVIGQTEKVHGGFNVKVVMVDDVSTALKIRLKGHTEILDTRTIDGSIKTQNITYYFDGEKIYADFVPVNVKGFAQGEVEFVIDDKVLGSVSGAFGPGSGKEVPIINIGVDAGQTRQLQVRKKGTTKSLMNKEVKAGAAAIPWIFYFDGEKVLDKIEAGPPANPANMVLIASFTSKLNIFRGPADLVLYELEQGKPSYESTATTMRIELPEDGTFSKSIEILAIQQTDRIKSYVFRIVKRGTLTELPYDLTNEILPMLPIAGFSANTLVFTPGGSAILTISDRKEYDDWDGGTGIYPMVIDIAPYFK